MSSTLVSARVPLIKRERASKELAKLGATTSDLINSAFDYVIQEGQLPKVETPSAAERSMADFEAFTNSCTFAVDWPSGDDLYEDAKAEALEERYGSLD